jgi:hypothetical protein
MGGDAITASTTLSSCNSSHSLRWSWVVHNGKNRRSSAISTTTKATILRLAHQTPDKAAIYSPLLLVRRQPGLGVESPDGREAGLPLHAVAEVDEISKMILKVQCYSCDYNSVQDTKRDPEGAMLEICREIHQNTYKNHLLRIVELSRDELEMLVISKHPKFRRHQRTAPAPSNLGPDHDVMKSRSAIFEIMADLRQMERGDLESLWSEYGTKD